MIRRRAVIDAAIRSQNLTLLERKGLNRSCDEHRGHKKAGHHLHKIFHQLGLSPGNDFFFARLKLHPGSTARPCGHATSRRLYALYLIHKIEISRIRLHISVSIASLNFPQMQLHQNQVDPNQGIFDDLPRLFSMSNVADGTCNYKINFKLLIYLCYLRKVMPSKTSRISRDFSNFMIYFQYFRIFFKQNKCTDRSTHSWSCLDLCRPK